MVQVHVQRGRIHLIGDEHQPSRIETEFPWMHAERSIVDAPGPEMPGLFSHRVTARR
jgi:hypothetical protein